MRLASHTRIHAKRRFALDTVNTIRSLHHTVRSCGTEAFASVTADDLAAFRDMLGDSKEGGEPHSQAVLTKVSDTLGYNVDWQKKYRGQAAAVLRPHNTQEVAQVLRYCWERRIAVVPQGGNTGLVGGGVPVFDEVVLSLSRMHQVLALDEVAGVLVCEAGCVLETLRQLCQQKGYLVPLDLGSKGSAQIGGNVATNAGGTRFMRYGSLHGSVLGLEVVRADGSVLDALRPLRKDNTGYHLKQLFIGSEGTLGVITKVALALPPYPQSVQTMLLGLANWSAVLCLLRFAKKRLGEAQNFQYSKKVIRQQGNSPKRGFLFSDLGCSGVYGPPLRSGRGGHAARHTSASRTQLPLLHGDRDQRQQAGARPGEAGRLLGRGDGRRVGGGWSGGADSAAGTRVLETQEILSHVRLPVPLARTFPSVQQAVYSSRSHSEGIAESLVKKGKGAVYKYDISLPVEHMHQFVKDTQQVVGDPSHALAVGYGHVADGNLHLNVSVPSGWDKQVEAKLEPWVYEKVAALGGSISAEHGLGQAKHKYLHLSKTPEEIELMRHLKRTLDPKGIMNPHKYLP